MRMMAARPDERPKAVAATVAAIRRRGIIVLGIYLGDQEQIGQLEAIFGAPFTIPVPQVSDLPRRLGRILVTYRKR